MRLQVSIVIFITLFWTTIGNAQRPDAPQYAERGSYAVGTMELTIPDDERPLNVTIWYPAAGNPTEDIHITYPFVFGFGVQGHAQRDVEASATDTPYPLVIFSHGSHSSRVVSLYYTEHLASYGFVVMAVDHPDNDAHAVALNDLNFVTTTALRPDDILRQIELAETLNTDGLLAGLIDTNNIAISGHSFGATTALQLGGARLNFNQLRRWCHDPEDQQKPENACFLMLLEGAIANERGYNRVPQGSWDSFNDPRIQAVTAFAPWNAPLLNVSGIRIPTLVMGGTGDSITPYERDALTIYQQLMTEKYLVQFDYADHVIFVDECAPVMLQFGLFDACSDPVWDMQRAHDIINHFGTAFLLYHLTGDQEAYAALHEDMADFRAVQYERHDEIPIAYTLLSR